MNDQKTRAMKTNGADLMGTGAIGKVLAQMSWPAILSMTINALYNIVDSIFVARLSQEALTAVSFVMPMQLLMISVTVGSGIGVNSLIARRLGARRQEEAEQAAGNSILIGLFNYMLFLIIGLFVTVPFMRHYTTEPSIYGYGVTYMRLVLTLSLFSSLEVIMEKVMQATGNMKGPMICSLSGAITNIILDPVLIFGLCGAPRLEVAGAAIATVIGQAVAFIIALFFLKRQKVLKLGRHSLRPRPAIIKDIYAVGFPSIVMQAIGSVMMIGYNTILAAEPTAVAVLGAYQKLQSFVFMPVFGLNQGALPLMGYNYGARNRERLMRTYKLALLSAITIMAIGFLLFQSIPHLFLKLFSADAKMLQMGIPALRRISICFLPAAYGIMTSTLFQATGHGTYSLFSSLIRQLVGILPLAYILYHYGGVEVSWLSFPLAEILGVLYMVLTFRHLYVKEIKNLDQITEN